MFVDVGMVAGDFRVGGREFFAEVFGDAGEIQDAEEDQHQADGKFHRQADAGGDGEAEEDDGGADDENRQCVADAPEDADPAGFQDGAFAADDGGDGDDVVGIGGVAHAEDEADAENGQGGGHGCVLMVSQIEMQRVGQLDFHLAIKAAPGFRRDVTQNRTGLTDGETQAHLYFAELRASAMQTENRGKEFGWPVARTRPVKAATYSPNNRSTNQSVIGLI